MKKHLIFAGAGHSHIHSIVNLDKFANAGIRITVVNRSEYHYYSGMGPGILSGFYNIDEVRFNIKEITENSGCRFIKGEVKMILPEENKIILSDNSELIYDLISFNTGSEVKPLKSSGDVKNLFTVKPVENIFLIRDRINGSSIKKNIVVIGGGAAGVEVASNICDLVYSSNRDAEISIITNEHLLSGYTRSFYHKSLRSLQIKGIKIYENKNVEMIDPQNILLSSGEILKYDIAVNASGIYPSRLFIDSKMKTGDDGGLIVNKYLQSMEYPGIFGGGDCITFAPEKLNKVGVYAVREGTTLFRNLQAYAAGFELEEFKPQKEYLTILNTGFKKGLMFWKGLSFYGHPAFYFKYYLDSRFMKKYLNYRRWRK